MQSHKIILFSCLVEHLTVIDYRAGCPKPCSAGRNTNSFKRNLIKSEIEEHNLLLFYDGLLRKKTF